MTPSLSWQEDTTWMAKDLVRSSYYRRKDNCGLSEPLLPSSIPHCNADFRCEHLFVGGNDPLCWDYEVFNFAQWNSACDHLEGYGNFPLFVWPLWRYAGVYQHTAVILPSGWVLVAGGIVGDSYNANCLFMSAEDLLGTILPPQVRTATAQLVTPRAGISTPKCSVMNIRAHCNPPQQWASAARRWLHGPRHLGNNCRDNRSVHSLKVSKQSPGLSMRFFANDGTFYDLSALTRYQQVYELSTAEASTPWILEQPRSGVQILNLWGAGLTTMGQSITSDNLISKSSKTPKTRQVRPWWFLSNFIFSARFSRSIDHLHQRKLLSKHYVAVHVSVSNQVLGTWSYTAGKRDSGPMHFHCYLLLAVCVPNELCLRTTRSDLLDPMDYK